MALVANYKASSGDEDRSISCPNCAVTVVPGDTQLPVTYFKRPAGDHGGGTFVMVRGNSMLHACALDPTQRVVLLRTAGGPQGSSASHRAPRTGLAPEC
jgi:hypothetical protein